MATVDERTRLLARCFFKQAEWQVEIHSSWEDVSDNPTYYSSDALVSVPIQRDIEDVLRGFHLATQYDPSWYKAWHTWALTNFDVVGHLESRDDNESAARAVELTEYIVQAITGAF